MRSASDNPTGRNADSSAAPEKASGSLRVLVAEDNPVNQRLTQAVLEAWGHTAVLAASGHEALAALEGEPFDIVLMDAQMPDMDGFQATAAIRAREGSTGAHVPIIAMTAHAQPGDRERCLAAGMDGYIAKPIRPVQLIELVESSAALRQRPQPAGALGMAAGDSVRRELAGLFVADAARIGAEIRDAVARRDGNALARAAHRLLGSAGHFSAQRICELARRLEELGKAGDFTAGTERACQELSEELARLEQILAADQDDDSC